MDSRATYPRAGASATLNPPRKGSFMARHHFCIDCGKLTDAGPRCPTHARIHAHSQDARARSQDARSHARQRADGRDTSWWRRFRTQVLERDGGRCVRCGSTWHLIADKIAGGRHAQGDELDEYQTLCGRCSGRKDGGRKKRKLRPEDWHRVGDS